MPYDVSLHNLLPFKDNLTRFLCKHLIFALASVAIVKNKSL